MPFKKGQIPWNKGLKGKQSWHNLDGLKLGQGWWKGKKQYPEMLIKLSEARKGKKRTLETKQKMSEAIYKAIPRGENHYRWNPDRELMKRNKRSDPEYKQWVRKVKSRDNFECKINNQDCFGYLEVHHILNWSNHPELRYEVNNGITLCQFHHPRTRAKEQELTPLFQELVYNLAN